MIYLLGIAKQLPCYDVQQQYLLCQASRPKAISWHVSTDLSRLHQRSQQQVLMFTTASPHTASTNAHNGKYAQQQASGWHDQEKESLLGAAPGQPQGLVGTCPLW